MKEGTKHLTTTELNEESHRHPTQIQEVVNSLVSRSYRLANAKGLQEELNFITKTFKQNEDKT